MDMKKHMLIYFFISMLVNTEKDWDSYQNEGSYYESWEIVIKKGNKKKK
jgi:hypothetical protein